MSEKYIFKSERLGFRTWTKTDVQKMNSINTDPEVMEFFPEIPTEKQTAAFIDRMQRQYIDKGFCYFAVDKLENDEFIGFIGISEQNFEADFTPCIDIGWRLAKKEWNKGFATEGAKSCLKYAFNELQLKSIKAITPEINVNSENVMKKIGMKKVSTFKHPKLAEYKRLEHCLLYEIQRDLKNSLTKNLV